MNSKQFLVLSIGAVILSDVYRKLCKPAAYVMMREGELKALTSIRDVDIASAKTQSEISAIEGRYKASVASLNRKFHKLIEESAK